MIERIGLGIIKVDLTKHIDWRGSLSVLEFGNDLSFKSVRLFIVESENGQSRGGHAHRWSSQLFICLSGKVELFFEGINDSIILNVNSSSPAIFIPPGIWGVQKFQDSQSKILVLSDYPYDPEDYITSRPEFMRFHQSRN